jgi:hypothetical protein
MVIRTLMALLFVLAIGLAPVVAQEDDETEIPVVEDAADLEPSGVEAIEPVVIIPTIQPTAAPTATLTVAPTRTPLPTPTPQAEQEPPRSAPVAPAAPRAPATCTDPPTMSITYGQVAVVHAQGFRPGSTVYAWLVRVGTSVSKPTRLPDLTWTVDEDCRIVEGFSVQATGTGQRALFLAGPRYGVGPEITMWRTLELQIRQ